ncbi:MAG: hypothetical protein PHU63_03915, partial [Candidatus ainarchaeum sp.]|nr:hypothetical protein [Candidatus ainarchaeum sp.]
NGKPRSNFFIFVKKSGEELIVSFYNPVQDATALQLPREMVYRRVKMKSGSPEKAVLELLEDIDRAMAFKKEFEYRAQLHGHLGGVEQEYDFIAAQSRRIRDDGVAHPLDYIKTAAYFHTDVLAWTAHNWINEGDGFPMYRIMLAICRELGILFPPATEITVPIKKGSPNGPHHLVLAGDWGAAQTIQREILSKREDGVSLISCYLGMRIDDMYRVLDPLKERRRIITGIAHPCNYNSDALQLKSIGMFSAVDLGHLTIATAMDFALHADFIASFNPTVSNAEMKLRDPKLKMWLEEAIRSRGVGSRVTANSANLAIAEVVRYTRESQGKAGNTSFDPDDHRVLPVSFYGRNFGIMGGDIFGMGHTRVVLSEKVVERMRRDGRKLTEREFVSGVSDGSIKLEAQVFYEQINGKPEIVKARRDMPKERKELDSYRGRIQDAGYVKRFIETTGYLLGEGKASSIDDILV